MTLQWIPLEALEAHPDNSNRMPPHLMEKLKGHIQRTGLYEPLVVRPLRNVDCGLRIERQETKVQPDQANPQSHYQILNGHHRAAVLRQLGHSHARCDVWEVDDAETLVLLATLNRLEGRDDPASRARLVAQLAASRPPEDLARLLPEPPDAVERLLAMARPPGSPLEPGRVEPALRPMTFFLTDEQRAAVTEALSEIRKSESRIADRGLRIEQQEATPPADANPQSSIRNTQLSRSPALERLALWYLESRNLR